MWKYYALLSAFFAALTAIFAKVGVKDINSDLATAIRTTVILLLTWGIVLFGQHVGEIREIPRHAWLFLVLSGVGSVARGADRQAERRHHHLPVVPVSEGTGQPAGGGGRAADNGRKHPYVTEMKLLIIEDERELSASIVAYLSSENYVCEQAFTYALLLAKIDNRQYGQMEDINLTRFLEEQASYLQSITGDIFFYEELTNSGLTVRANRTLLESLVNSLVVNAVRYNCPGGEIYLTVSGRELAVSNTSDEPALDAWLIFNRFYRPSEKVKGNGLGLAIVKAVCEYHEWKVEYQYRDNRYCFIVNF